MKKSFLSAIIYLIGICSVNISAQIHTAEEVWANRYNDNTTNGYDILHDMTIDGNGNVYVTGYSFNLTTSRDYVTIKYSSSGNQEWLARYNNNDENGWDEGRFITVDASGNVYVLGLSDGGSTHTDFLTVKYDASGNQLWTARYDGPGEWGDIASGLAVDNSGNVYITGDGSGTNDHWDITTIKYNSSGAEQWVATYNGVNNLTDGANAIAVDASGNVYVTGVSFDADFNGDIVTIKYNTSGGVEWINLYEQDTDDIALDIVTDGSYVYLTGNSFGATQGLLTIKLNAATGAYEWTVLHSGSSEGTDITLDANGNIIVTGTAYSSSTSNDWLTVKYNSSGVQQWASLFDANGNQDDPSDLTVDESGNVYVTGFRQLTSLFWERDMATIKYDGDGEFIWIKTFDGGSDNSEAVAVDGSGNVYIAGVVGGLDSANYFDYMTIKYEQLTLTVPEAIDEAKEDLQDLPLNAGNKNALNSKLTNAIAKYNSGDLLAAKNILLAFLNQLNQFVTDGDITAAEAQPLIDFVNLILDEINSLLAKITGMQIPDEFSLSQNYPNPFNPVTAINWQIPVESHVTIKIYDVLGKEILTLVDEVKQPGNYSSEFNASQLPSGMYVYQISAGDFTAAKKMILMK